MKVLNNFAMVLTKIAEVIHWLADITALVFLILSRVATDKLADIIAQVFANEAVTLNSYGFEVVAGSSGAQFDMRVVRLFLVAAIFIFPLMAMVFRNLYLIIKKSRGSTPFQKDNVRMLKEIGIFTIAVPVISLILSVIIRLVVGVDAVETSVGAEGFIMGILVFVLTQMFAHGVELEKDVDGLL